MMIEELDVCESLDINNVKIRRANERTLLGVITLAA
jgi:hypothetical protein